MGTYEGKTAVVTGGTSGIGLATARLLLAEGARVVVTGRSAKGLEAARAELGARAIVVESDSASLADIDALVATVKKEVGTIDLLFVNAGIAKFAPLAEVTEAGFDETFGINIKGPLFLVQRLAGLIRDGGAVVLNTSVVDEKGFAGTSVYSASKAALRSLARTLATELLPRGIRVNAVSPGPITTAIFSRMELPKEHLDAMATQFREMVPMKRFGRAEEVAKAVAFLGFDATFSTGIEVPIDGGLSSL